MRDLLRRAKDAVRARLLAIAPPAVQEEIKRVLNEIAREAPPPGRNFGVAEELVKLMKELNELDDAAVYKFAESKKFDEVTVALAVLNDDADRNDGPADGRPPRRPDPDSLPVGPPELADGRVDPAQPAGHASINEQTLEIAERDYRKLSMETAQRTVRFWQLHNRIEK